MALEEQLHQYFVIVNTATIPAASSGTAARIFRDDGIAAASER
jgi:hypothetical protein